MRSDSIHRALKESTYDRVRNGDTYSLVLQHRTSQIWPPLSMDPVFTGVAEDWFTNLDKVNPLIEVYRRNDSFPAFSATVAGQR